VKTIKTEIGSKTSETKKAFCVRKSAVEKALRWLKQNNPLYQDIDINMSNLDWIEGPTGSLIDNTIEVEDEIHTQEDNNATNADMGPAPRQAFEHERESENVKYYGYLDQGETPILSEDDSKINDSIQEAVSKSPNKVQISIDYPAISHEPVSEFGDKKIFAMAFPWLFPGGFGDIKDFTGSMTTWGRNMLHYEDGRFATDKMFSFFCA